MRLDKSIVKKWFHKQWILILVLLGAALWGGFYHFTVALWGCVFSACLAVICCRTGRLRLPRGTASFGLAVMTVCSVISVFAADDRGSAVIGMIRMLVIAEFWLLWNQISGESREKAFAAVPLSGTVLTMFCYAAYFIPALQDSFYSAGRLGGTFQYSNTYAVFLLAGFLVAACRAQWKKTDLFQMGILLSGIVLTGSRSVFVMTAVALVIVLLRKRIRVRVKALILAGAAAVVFVLQLVMQADVSRLFKLTLNSSTLNGRILYWIDALPVILKHPLGLGYLGYYYLQPQIQTGNYMTKFVHNDLLQCALDWGIAAAAAMVLVVCAGLHRNSVRNTAILAVLALHALFDFDMQFLMMACLALMCFKTDAQPFCQNRRKKKLVFPEKIIISETPVLPGKAARPVCCAAVCVFVYFCIAFGLEYAGQYSVSLKMYPWNSLARESLMYETEDGREELAQAIIDRNGMLASAYEAMLLVSVNAGEYQEALDYEQRMLSCAGYQSSYYNQAVYYLSYALDTALRSGDTSAGQEILEELQGIPARIAQVEADASRFAYRINDAPEIELESSVEDYLESLEGISIE